MRTTRHALFAAVLSLLPALTLAAEPAFRSAQPVWPKGRETEMNLSVGFCAAFDWAGGDASAAVLRATGASIYRAWVNGEFVAHGPARGPHGHYRVDQWNIGPKLRQGKNVVAVEVAGYNANSYYLLDQPSFLQAEVTVGDRVLASTAGAGATFVALPLDYRVQKVQRYSFQRPFIEVYRLGPGFDAWTHDPAAAVAAAELAVQPPKPLLDRGVPLPEFAVKLPRSVAGAGQVEPRAVATGLWKDRSLTDVGPKLKGYPEKDLERVVSTELQQIASRPVANWTVPQGDVVMRVALKQGAYQILDFGANLTGFPGARISCTKKARVALTFDEILTAGDVDFKRLGCVNAICWDLAPGTYRVESIEPYTFRYLKLIALEGDCEFDAIALREFAHPEPQGARFASSDPRLNKLYAAGVLTFRQNCLDLFMDCPSRERAGWLCDSFFTSRVAADLTGVPAVERNFFENYRLPPRFAHLPDGMLPMCYPADHNDGVFIPNWALWFVVQLEEYAARSDDRAAVDALRPKVLALFDYFKRFENSDGLLEKLESWVFVEWSKANDFVQDVNYPSNMLYAAALAAAGRTYRLPELEEKAQKIRATIRRQSFDGEFFVDNALRRDGKLAPTRNRTEVCQYFAFFFGTADRTSHAKLWKTLRDEFGPQREKTKAHPEIHPANSFVGNVLRLELLSQDGRGRQILDESIAYLLYMADRTGTLWENVGAYASCNHGFASHVVHTLYRDVLGLARVDAVQKTVAVRFADAGLEWCDGALLTPDGPIELRWKRGAKLVYRLKMPAGYQATVENASGLEAVREE